MKQIKLEIQKLYEALDKLETRFDKIKNFKALYPKYDGLIIADGGIQKNHLNSLKEIGVDIVVQGGAIFG